jgi:flagellar biosynthesis component FlhA
VFLFFSLFHFGLYYRIKNRKRKTKSKPKSKSQKNKNLSKSKQSSNHSSACALLSAVSDVNTTMIIDDIDDDEGFDENPPQLPITTD